MTARNIALLVALAGFLVAGCATSSNDLPDAGDQAQADTQETSSEPTAAPPEEPAQPEPGPEESTQEQPEENPQDNTNLSVGDTATFSGQLTGVRMTLEQAFTMPPDEMSMLRPGEDYLILQFRIQNESPEALYLYGTELDFYAYNQDSYELAAAYPDAYAMGEAERGFEEITGTEVRTGGDVLGSVAFAVEEGDSVLVEWVPDMMNGVAASWDLGPVAELPSGTLGGAGAAAGQYE